METKIAEKFLQRSRIGIQKYGTTLDREDLSVYDWINHAQEECMDAVLYLEKLKQVILDKMLDDTLKEID